MSQQELVKTLSPHQQRAFTLVSAHGRLYKHRGKSLKISPDDLREQPH